MPTKIDEDAIMFCPNCGQPMTLTDSDAGKTYTCVPGDMQLSRTMHDRLFEVFVARSRHGRPHALDWGGRWFCPGCGGPAATEAEHVRCPNCNEYLDEFLYQLVELHPHRADGARGWT